MRTFAAHAHAGGLAPRSIQRRLSAVRSFYQFLLRESPAELSRGARSGSRVRSNPAQGVRAPKSARRLPQTLDADQMARLLEIPAGDALSARDRALMELLYSSGLRLAELVGLDLREPRPQGSHRARARQGQASHASCRSGARRSRRCASG